MDLFLIKDIGVIFGIAVIVLIIFQRFKIPTIIGLFLTGMIAGPQGLGLISGINEVQLLSEIGIILLLFTIALEFTPENFAHIRRISLLGGSIQMITTTGVVGVIGYLIGLDPATSLVLGFLVALSSTAVVLKTLQQKQLIDSPQGRTSLGILIFQDLAVVPLILILPFLGGGGGQLSSVFISSIQGILIILGVFITARWITPRLLRIVAQHESRELFLLSIIFICFAVTFLTTSLGLSPALGAFLAGLIVANSEYSQRALGNVMPFQEVFLSFFFVSLGMLLDWKFILVNLPIIIALSIGFIIIKFLFSSLTTRIIGFKFRISLMVGIILAQIGEFSFVLAQEGLKYSIITYNFFQIFLAVSLITMGVAPFLIDVSPKIVKKIMQIKVLRPLWDLNDFDGDSYQQGPHDHIIVVGYGISGQKAVKEAQDNNIPYRAVDINPEIINLSPSHVKLVHGDAALESVLLQLGIKNAKAMIIAVSDFGSSKHIVEVSRRMNCRLKIITRTRYKRESEILEKLGADQVVSEECEASKKINKILDNIYDI